ncbi:Histone deacetylase hda1 [Lunasporangiospora selenospora]|uniref:histone deacetylase n=1 Tax=Lunasporangiospora selenospora TaxID=979761 RepID=A0A9P6FRP3_9FUNG|nr:Histone deacetylase hda1 [Lunasporangiospora selenospora]
MTGPVPEDGDASITAIQNGTPLAQPDFIDGRSTKTGYVYDVRMRFHSNVHGEDDHPEDPRRIWKIYDALQTARCTERMVKISSREATTEELGLVHTEGHINNITRTTDMNKDELLSMANNYNSIYLNNSSAFCARLSCGSLLELCKAVALGQILNGVAIVRPPGHHAEPDEAGGFCLYNNVAIAARYLQKYHGLKKIFILDWDVHHGNGTQKAFIDDPDVVYCSIHRFDNGTFYPGDPIAGAHSFVGEGPGRGRNINIPWPGPGMGDSEYIYTFHKVIMPIIFEFAPDFILVSAGFDAAKGDHIGEMLVSPAAYGHMTHMLKSLAGGKIILALEGGYNLESIAVSGLACTKALLSDPIDPLGPIIPSSICVQTIHEVLEVQSRYWKSLTPTCLDPTEGGTKARGKIVDVAKVLGVYRSESLYQQHNMLKMPISDGSLGDGFQDSVHCTQDLHSTKPLYIFIHNLGEFCARTLGSHNIIRSDKSFLVDSVAQYVDRIVSSGNQLIDVVVPYQPATEEEKGPLKEKLSTLLADIWDNFVYMTGCTRRIILLAAGFGCHGMVAFMNERQKDVSRYVSCAVMIPGSDEPLPMVTRRLGPWYIENSFVYVPEDHPTLERVNQKVNSRIGNLVSTGKLTAERLSDTLADLYDDMFSEIEDKLSELPPLQLPIDLKEFKQEPSSSSSLSTLNGASPTPTEASQGQQDPVVKTEPTSSMTGLVASTPTPATPPVKPSGSMPPQQQQQQPPQQHPLQQQPQPPQQSQHSQPLPLSQSHAQAQGQGQAPGSVQQRPPQNQGYPGPAHPPYHPNAQEHGRSGPAQPNGNHYSNMPGSGGQPNFPRQGPPPSQPPQPSQQPPQQPPQQQQQQQQGPPSHYSLVDRSSVAGGPPRPQPYPTPNGRSHSGNHPMSSPGGNSPSGGLGMTRQHVGSPHMTPFEHPPRGGGSGSGGSRGEGGGGNGGSGGPQGPHGYPSYPPHPQQPYQGGPPMSHQQQQPQQQQQPPISHPSQHGYLYSSSPVDPARPDAYHHPQGGKQGGGGGGRGEGHPPRSGPGGSVSSPTATPAPLQYPSPYGMGPSGGHHGSGQHPGSGGGGGGGSGSGGGGGYGPGSRNGSLSHEQLYSQQPQQGPGWSPSAHAMGPPGGGHHPGMAQSPHMQHLQHPQHLQQQPPPRRA